MSTLPAPVFLQPRPAVPLHEIAARSDRAQRDLKLQQAEQDMARQFAERSGVPSPSVHTLAHSAAKHASDYAFWLGRIAIYHARGDHDVSDCMGYADAAFERLSATVRQLKELPR
jgi:type III secretory pathway component EscV